MDFLQFVIAKELGINMLPDPPSEWDTATTLYMATLLEMYQEAAAKSARRRGRRPVFDSDAEEDAYNRAAGEGMALLDDDGEPLRNEQGEIITVAEGDKTYEVSDEEFEEQWQLFLREEEARLRATNA